MIPAGVGDLSGSFQPGEDNDSFLTVNKEETLDLVITR